MKNSIKFLGAQGSKAPNSAPTCIQLSQEVLIDAGNILQDLGKKAVNIQHVFLTHSHLDHILDLGFYLDVFFAKRNQPLKVYGLKSTLLNIKEHYFNNIIWPDFTKINLANGLPSIELIEVEYGKEYSPQPDLVLTPLKANHLIETCGYLINKNNHLCLFGADSYENQGYIDLVNNNLQIKTLILDVAFPNKLEKIAESSKHLTPKLLKKELSKITRTDLKVFVFHLKPCDKKEILNELELIGFDTDQVLNDGDVLDLATAKVTAKECSLCQQTQIDKLNQIGIALSAEKNINKLLELIVTEAKSLTQADGGTLYLLKDEYLFFTVAQTDSLGVKMGGTSGPITWPPLPLYLSDGKENRSAVAVNCALSNQVIALDDIYNSTDYSFASAKAFDLANNYCSKSMLVVPLVDFEGKVIGVLQLLNKQQNNQSIAFSTSDESLTLSLASQAAVALNNAQLVDDLEQLLESFLNSIIYTIGRKSPYTAGHINRMVDLSEMLSHKINQDQTIFSEINYTEEQLQQIKLAALMHDIGKLATPEVVMDKATKLDGHFDRIELVEMRANYIRTLLEKQLLLSPKNSQPDLVVALERLTKAVELIKNTNLGGEFLPDEQVAEINQLAQIPFVIGAQSEFLLTEDEAYNLIYILDIKKASKN